MDIQHIYSDCCILLLRRYSTYITNMQLHMQFRMVDKEGTRPTFALWIFEWGNLEITWCSCILHFIIRPTYITNTQLLLSCILRMHFRIYLCNRICIYVSCTLEFTYAIAYAYMSHTFAFHISDCTLEFTWTIELYITSNWDVVVAKVNSMSLNF